MSSGGGGSSSSGGGGGGGQSYSPSAGPAGGASAGGNYGGNVNTSQSYGGSTPSNDNGGGGGGGGQSYQPPAPVVTAPVAPVPVAPVAPVVPDLPEPTNIYEKIAQDAAIEDANNQVIENIILNNIYDEVALTGGNIAPTPVSVEPTPTPIPVEPIPVAPVPVEPTPTVTTPIAPPSILNPEPVAPTPVVPITVAPEQVAPITVAPEQVAPTPTAPPSILNPPAPIEPTPIEPTPVVPTAVAPPSILNPPTPDEPLDIEDFREIPVIDIPTVPLQNPQPVQTLPTAPPSILNPEPIVTEPTAPTAVAPPSILNPEPIVTTDIDRPNIAEITDGVAPIDIDLPVGGGVDASQTDFTVPETPNTESGKDSTETKLDYLTGDYQDIELTDEQKQVLEDQRQEARYAISPMEDPINKAIGYGLSFLFPGAGLLYGAYKNATAMGYSIPNPFEGLLGGEPTQENVQSKLNEMNFGGGDNGDNQGYVPQTTPTTQTPQSDGSMVNQYFSNLNMGGQYSLSSDLQTSYNNAKSSINNILGINQQSQQFGYSAQPYGSYSRTDLTNNPYYIDYLKQRGLI